MATADDLKLARDGTLSYGVKRQPWDGWLWPVTVRVGRNARGKVVATEKMFSPTSGSITYGDVVAAVEWMETGQGRVIREYRSAHADD